MSTRGPDVHPERVLAELRDLSRLTCDAGGARRLAWSPEWSKARAWLSAKLLDLPCHVHLDPAGNLLADLPGGAPGYLAIGSHLDSVPGGGWLDGALGVMAGLELLRAYAEHPQPPAIGLRLIDWADEEGARFGRSLFGSSAATGTLDLGRSAELVDSDGVTVKQAMAACGLDIDAAGGATRSLDDVRAYLELHIEQGPLLETTGHQLGVVTGTAGVQRRVLHLEGQAAHAGAAPMDMRRDPVVAAARIITALVELAVGTKATATFGAIGAQPGVGTIVPERCRVIVDLRHPDTAVLTRLVADADAAVTRISAAARVTARWEPQWSIEPIPFDPELVKLASASCADVDAPALVMASGALHDAAAVARLLPVVMLFTPSRGGISHSPAEDTAEVDLAAGVRALAALTHRTIEWILAQAPGRLVQE